MHILYTTKYSAHIILLDKVYVPTSTAPIAYNALVLQGSKVLGEYWLRDSYFLDHPTYRHIFILEDGQYFEPHWVGKCPELL